MQNNEQQLASLKQLLSLLGQPDIIDHHILYPGLRREQLIRGLMTRWEYPQSHAQYVLLHLSQTAWGRQPLSA